MKVCAIQGINGSYHYEAAQLYFKQRNIDMLTLECETYKDLAQCVSGSDADYGIVAVENSVAGSIFPNYNLITKYNLHVVGETILPIHIHLLGLEQNAAQLKEIWSHSTAILQCEEYLDDKLQWNILSKNDTASCAKKVKKEHLTHIGVLASEVAAKLYGLKIIERDVQNEGDCFTRYFVVSKKNQPIQTPEKCSLLLTLEHKSGSLFHLLEKSEENNINITKLQTIASLQNNQEMSLYLDFLFDNEAHFQAIMTHLESISKRINILGVY